MSLSERDGKRTLLVLASTYPRWADDPEPGFVHELARRLTGRFRVIALVPHAPGAAVREVMDGVEIHRYRYAPRRWETLVNDGGIVANLKRDRWKCLLVPSFVLAQAWHAWRLLRRERIDVIHAHWLVPQGAIAALLQYLPGRRVPFIVTSHGADLYALQGRLLDAIKLFVLRKSFAATVVSTAMRENLGFLGADTRNITVQPMGVDLVGRFGPDASVTRSAREILFVGRLVEKKGLRHLLNAMPAILREFPDAFLTVAGFGPEEVALKGQVEASGLACNVRFVGALPQEALPALYRRAAVFVAPFVKARSGDEEGLGLVLVEALACECPILAGRVRALVEVLGDSVEEVAVNPLDADELSGRIMALLADPASAQARAAALSKAIGGRFDWNVVGAGYAALIASVPIEGRA